jgi:hypothetical protein
MERFNLSIFEDSSRSWGKNETKREIYWNISQNMSKLQKTVPSWWVSLVPKNRYQSCTQLQVFILRLFSMEVRLLPKTFGIINLDYSLGACGTPFCGTTQGVASC